MGWLELSGLCQNAVSAAFGDAEITYEPASGAPYPITGGTYRSTHEEVSLEGLLTINTEQPVVGVQRSKLQADPDPADHVTVGQPYEVPSKRFRVREALPDGDGWLYLILVDDGS